MLEKAICSLSLEEVGHSIHHEVIIDFVMTATITIIESYCVSIQNERSKSERSSGSPLSKTPEVESQRHTMAFLRLGKH